jgi:hypothetical protein
MDGRRKGGATSSSRLAKDLEEFQRKVDRGNRRRSTFAASAAGSQRSEMRQPARHQCVTLSTAAVSAIGPVALIAPKSVEKKIDDPSGHRQLWAGDATGVVVLQGWCRSVQRALQRAHELMRSFLRRKQVGLDELP